MSDLKTIPFLRFTKLYFILSLLVLIPGTISLVAFGLKPSIDFTGGSLIEISSPEEMSSEQIQSAAEKTGLEVGSIQSSTDSTYFVRSKQITQSQSEEFVKNLQEIQPKTQINKFESIGPVVGAELTQKAIIAVIVATLFIVLYIAWSFRNVPKPYSSWKFGLSAVVAMIHDTLVVLGLFSLLGHFSGVEVDALFVTALLTVIGFSVHDTIVVFDRIRENLVKMPKSTFVQVVDYSLTETVGRSINTSITVLLTLLALLLFGGESIRWFVFALFVGVTSGTFSSIFNAAPILAIWESKQAKLKH